MTASAHRPAAADAPPTEATRAVAVSPAGRVVRWTRWGCESGEEFEARVREGVKRLGLERVRFLTGRDGA